MRQYSQILLLSAVLVGCKTTQSNQDLKNRDELGTIGWNTKILSELPIGSTLTLKRDAAKFQKDLFGTGEKCTIFAPTMRVAKFAKGTKFTLLGQVAGFETDEPISGNWLVASVDSYKNQVGIACSDNNRMASANTDMTTLQGLFDVKAMKAPVSIDKAGKCEGQWVASFLQLDLGAKAVLRTPATRGTDNELDINSNGKLFCTLKPSILGPKRTLTTSYPVGTVFKIAGQSHNWILRNNEAYCGTGLILDDQNNRRYLMSCVDMTSKGALFMPQQDLQLEALKAALDF